MSGEIHEWPPPPEINQARDASKSTTEEVQSLLDRGAPLAIQRSTPWIRRGAPIGAMVLLAAAVIFWMMAPWPNQLKTGDFVTLDGQVTQVLGQSITFTGVGALHIEKSDDSGHQLRLLKGQATFVVDPNGTDRNLTVYAGETAVRVTGTVFGVAFKHEKARVWVERGRVEVTHDGTVYPLTTQEEWFPPEPIAALPNPIVAPAAIPEPSTRPASTKPSLKRTPRFADTAESKAAYQAIDHAYAIDSSGPGVFQQINAFLKNYPKSRHREAVLLYQIELSEPIESEEWRLKKVRAFLKAYPKSKHRRGLIALRDRLEVELNR